MAETLYARLVTLLPKHRLRSNGRCTCELDCLPSEPGGPREDEKTVANWARHLAALAVEQAVEVADGHVMPSSTPVGSHFELASEDSLDRLYVELGGKLS